MADTHETATQDNRSIESIRKALANIIVSRDIDVFDTVVAEYGAIPVWVDVSKEDDPNKGSLREPYPLRRHRIGDLRVEVGTRAIGRVFWRDVREGSDDPGTGNEFTLQLDNLTAITRVLSEEDIE